MQVPERESKRDESVEERRAKKTQRSTANERAFAQTCARRQQRHGVPCCAVLPCTAPRGCRFACVFCRRATCELAGKRGECTKCTKYATRSHPRRQPFVSLGSLSPSSRSPLSFRAVSARLRALDTSLTCKGDVRSRLARSPFSHRSFYVFSPVFFAFSRICSLSLPCGSVRRPKPLRFPFFAQFREPRAMHGFVLQLKCPTFEMTSLLEQVKKGGHVGEGVGEEKKEGASDDDASKANERNRGLWG